MSNLQSYFRLSEFGTSDENATDKTADTWADPQPQRILGPLDFPEPSKHAACFAREWAKLFSAQIALTPHRDQG